MGVGARSGLQYRTASGNKPCLCGGETSPHPSRLFAVTRKQSREKPGKEQSGPSSLGMPGKKMCEGTDGPARGGLSPPTLHPLAHHILSQI